MSSTNYEINPLTESNSYNYYLSNAYKMIVFSIRSEVTRKYYERRLRYFLLCILDCTIQISAAIWI